MRDPREPDQKHMNSRRVYSQCLLFLVVIIILSTVIFSEENGITWESTVLLNCDLKEERGVFRVWTDKQTQEVVSDDRND